MNREHPQLRPSVNRSRRIPGGPAALPRQPHHVNQPPPDPENPYRMTHTGLFTDTLRDESGAERPYAFYIPTTMKTSGSMALVFVPGGEEPAAYFRAAGWQESLERHCVTAYFLGAPQGWQKENPGLEMDAATRVLGEMRSMEYFPSNAPAIYCVGLQWLLCMVVTTLTAYPLSRSNKQLFGRTVLAWYFFIPMIFNGGLVPNFMVISTLGLLGSIWALVLPAVVVTFYVLLLMNFIRGLPAEMEEAAMIDGASPLQVLTRIILPVMVPCLATITVYTTLANWNEWFYGIIYMNEPAQYPLMSYLRSTVLISNMENLSPQEQERLANIGNKTYQAAQLFIASVPMLLLYPFLQKYFTKGLVLGSVKG